MRKRTKENNEPLKALDFLEHLITYGKLKGIDKELLENITWLQKIVFFIHWTYLHETGKLFFDDKFEAWAFGPIIFNLHEAEENLWWLYMTSKNTINTKSINKEKWEHFQKTFEKYSQYTTWELIEKSTNLESWKKNFINSIDNITYGKNQISKNDMLEDKYK